MDIPKTYKIIFEHASTADLQQIKTLGIISYKQYADVIGTEHWATMKQNLSNDNMLTGLLDKSVCFVARSGSELVGMAFLLPSGNPVDVYEADWCSIRLVAVHPDFRGKRIAKTLTENCIDHARKGGEKIIALHTSSMMPAAISLYENLGFKKIRDLGLRFGQPYFLYTLQLNS